MLMSARLLSYLMLSLGVLCANDQVRAQGQTQCGPPRVAFVNGVWNDPSDTPASAAALDAVLVEEGITLGSRIEPFYNPGDGILSDLLEVSGDHPRLAALIRAAVANPDGLDVVPPDNPILEAAINDAKARSRRTTNELKSFILQRLSQGGPVVLIAHSQGTIYAARAIQELQTAAATQDLPGVQTIGLLGIGVAAPTAAANYFSESGKGAYFRYITSSGDLVIDNPALTSPPANFFPRTPDLPPPLDYLLEPAWQTDIHGLQHELVDVYLNPDYVGIGPNPSLGLVSSRQVVGHLFREVLQQTRVGTSCVDVTLSGTPNPTTPDAQTHFTVSVTPRVGVESVSSGTVEVREGSQVLCRAPASSQSMCSGALAGSPRTATVIAYYLPAPSSQFQDGFSAPLALAVVGPPILAANYTSATLLPGAWKNGQPLPTPGPVTVAVQFAIPIPSNYTGRLRPDEVTSVTFESSGVGSVTLLGVQLSGSSHITFSNGMISLWSLSSGLHSLGATCVSREASVGLPTQFGVLHIVIASGNGGGTGTQLNDTAFDRCVGSGNAYTNTTIHGYVSSNVSNWRYITAVGP